MNGTPRLRSSWPSTPGSDRQNPDLRGSPQNPPKARSPLPNLPDNAPPVVVSNTPVIPVTLIDAPSQRMYTFGVYGLLLVWRLYDWWKLVEDDTQSFPLFFKWSCIDLAFMFGVPLLRIPWLEWSDTTSFTSCFFHAIMNGMLMFRIPVSS
jgi:nucleoporin POM152